MSTLTIMIILVVVIAGFATFVSVLPTARVHWARSAVINASSDAVFALLVDLQRHLEWAPWEHYDPEFKMTYTDIRIGEGAIAHWSGVLLNEGQVTISKALPNKLVRLDLALSAPELSMLAMEYHLAPSEGGGTEITWHIFEAPEDNDLRDKMIGFFMGRWIDKAINGVMKRGFANIEAILTEEE